MTPYQRSCPKCQVTIYYSTKYNARNAERDGRICRKCVGIPWKGRAPEAALKALAEKYATDPTFQRGQNNSFYGKHHTEETKRKLSESVIQFASKNTEVISARMKKIFNEGRAGICSRLGKTNYEIWVKKYGVEEADIRQAALVRKHSENSRGTKNRMYGKPAPRGAGNGWKGWYRDIFFRSLRELFFIIELESKRVEWENGEMTKHGIEYEDDSGQMRTYYTDYVVEGVYYEIKPKRLWTSREVQTKIQGAAKKGIVVNLVDPVIDGDKIRHLYEKGLIKFMPKYEEKIKAYLKNA